ncbi:M23 family metallopeptidase [Bacillus horti]|uniref:M23ase beta-sheet core domain-containing protein n=1 Tax=Caldalkalibacillus horti TaxID=77523 RepID=A0ABT9VVR0_9BACI|nr:M23 family metallopeptidase [Bacillus horti]MDQ0165084.1 hypothetical protein [Bacillus horti]
MKAIQPVLKSIGVGALALTLLTACSTEDENIPIDPDNSESTEQTDPVEGDEGESIVTIDPQEFGEAFTRGDFSEIYAQTSSDFKAAVDEAAFIELSTSYNENVTSFELLSTIPVQGLMEYLWIDQSGTKGIQTYFDADQAIAGLQLTPLSSFPETDEKLSETSFIVPTTETWFTFWGGRNVMVNYHYAVESQRYAYDWSIMQNGSSYAGDPAENESYFAFGKEVVAPAGGTVISVENGIQDNTPQVETNAEQPLGNHVILDHGNGEFSVLAHFKEGSVTVAEGDTVEQGDLLGLCGNSGNSSEPHIHFHVMDDADWMHASSIRVNFEGEIDPKRGDEVPAGKN